MFAKKDLVLIPHTDSLAYRRKLQILYARRSAIDTLIESLRDYDRFRVQRTEGPKRQLA